MKFKLRTDIVGQLFWPREPNRVARFTGNDLLPLNEEFNEDRVAWAVNELACGLKRDTSSEIDVYTEDGIWIIEINGPWTGPTETFFPLR